MRGEAKKKRQKTFERQNKNTSNFESFFFMDIKAILIKSWNPA